MHIRKRLKDRFYAGPVCTLIGQTFFKLGGLVVDNVVGELCQDEAYCGAVSRLDVDREPGSK